MTIVPFIDGWTVQWNGYEPAALNERLCGASPVMFFDIVQEPSSSPTLCGTASPFVQVMTSPTLALTGPHAFPPTDASTSAAVPAAGSEHTDAAAVWEPLVGVPPPPPEQAASRSAAAATVPVAR